MCRSVEKLERGKVLVFFDLKCLTGKYPLTANKDPLDNNIISTSDSLNLTRINKEKLSKNKGDPNPKKD
ncbi:hypothetical protein N7456_001493 [Penicillium angulare]|uniref:Uncharacterized protein n=1 Tax=Penicillium angulare TaxID=116970 RepID=A0A9W9G697_9EURO|nr:hypothetical protein N7456_001493 [Penicillium angulare]